ncbi:MAG: phosphomannomutase, partial [SAR324 cluster bacterium]|nr:phosphomannomutase [SAR324 cluster bacterium]
YLTHLTNTVRENKADFGVGWDGDADRIGIVDENGEVIYGDMLVLLYAREILKEKPGCTIIGDVKCSHRLFDYLTKHGANAIMSKTGHSLIKNKLKETGGELAGELSGHMFFNHRFFGFDDAIYATARFVELASNWEGPMSQMLGDLPKTFSTPEIRLDCSEQNKFQIPVKIAKSFSKQYPVITVDGARVKFPKGWGLVRASNTQSCLILRFEAEDPESLKDYQALMTEEINKLL